MPGRTSLACAALVTLSCADPAEPAPRVLELVSVLPQVDEAVYLNEPLVLYFSSELDRSSVTSSSVRIRTAEGERVRGAFEVDGDSLRFVPARVFASDLSDGGFRPGARYVVELSGFPDPAALRAQDGAPLAHSYRWSFASVSGDDDVPFQDDTPQRGSALVPYWDWVQRRERTLVEGRPLMLVSAEPLDPSTLRDADFRILAGPNDSIAVRARLVPAPDDPGPELPVRPDAGWIELLPVARLAPGLYHLAVAPDLALRDYGKNPIWPSDTLAREFRVVASGISSARGELGETFLDTALRSPLPPPAFAGRALAGAACWSGDGVVRIRFPAAAGDGSAGDVTLSGAEARDDVHASRLVLPADAECRLTATGLVVLRSQTSLHLSGRLLRTSGDARGETMKDAQGGATLSEFLRAARASGRPWTVLVAGGDLVIDGDAQFDTPVLCVAGGLVRVLRPLSHPPNEFWILGEGGGSRFAAERADLVLDEPELNPLVVPLEVGVLSSPLPTRGKVLRWLEGMARGRAGSGHVSVRYVSEPEDPEQLASLVPVDLPRLLDTPQIRVWIELTMKPGVPWDPPIVDEVRLTWEEDERR